ncbi:S-layer homology domain-containing protein [Nostocaceae cyanobacterium CENA357]|uniref:S-layer homology domain-containing protein n=1 Tax=Atlanticothrix silvestris CENA357 TaxID=1725252 RepID=A0A8J7HHV8_9CYAN|nr:S-layer homology domain-containing protein [Atlanticothrix silvestris]MBH8555552.1 S-layer homology domain-containing protein [Atlanticothrix silvestris CENA357]
MTNRPPDDPQSSQTTALGFDDFIGILVAFSAIGGILFWSLSRQDPGNFNWIMPRVKPSPVSPSPAPTLEPTPDVNLDTRRSLPDTDVTAPIDTPDSGDGVISPPVFPPANIAPPINSTPRQKLLPFPIGFESSIKSSPQPLVSPAKKKSIIPPPIAFNDVPTDFWASRFIDVLSSRGMIKGFPDYSFRPNQPVNRAEFAAILQQTFDKEGTNSTLSFTDVPTTSWATPAINQALSTGFLKGYPNKTFKPEQKIPRVQVLVALVSGLNLKEPVAPDQVLSIYKDAKDIPQYATGKIAAATANGLVINYPDSETLAPNKETTRAEVAAMVYQALVKTRRVEKITSPYLVQSSQ